MNPTRNKITVLAEFAVMELGYDLQILIDVEDIPRLRQHKWFHREDKCGRIYAITAIWQYGKTNHLQMHNLLCPPTTGLEVDHENGNSLDNRKFNLRVVTRKQNCENKIRARNDSTTGIRGVMPFHSRGRHQWIAQIRSNGSKVTRYFPFTDEGLELAKQAVIDLRKEHFTHSTI